MVKQTGKVTTKKPVKKKPAAIKKPAAKTKTARPRRVKQRQYRSFRLEKRIKHPVRLPNVFRLSRTAGALLWSHKRLFAGITAIYGLLNLLLVQGIMGGTDITELKHLLEEIIGGHLGSFKAGLSIFALQVSSAGNSTSETAGAYQVFLALIGSLAIIWALRQAAGGVTVRVRDAYYRGMYPLVPFILVLAVIGLQLIPLLIGSALYGIVVSNGIAVYFVEKLLWAMLYGLLVLLTLYMLTSSLFALYIATLPDMTPMKALRSARELVRYRRWTVLRKVVVLPIILLIIAAVIMVPIIMFLTPLAEWVFFLLTMSLLAAVHAYMYTLYRELLRE